MILIRVFIIVWSLLLLGYCFGCMHYIGMYSGDPNMIVIGQSIIMTMMVVHTAFMVNAVLPARTRYQ